MILMSVILLIVSTSNKGYQRYSKVCFIHCPTPRNWQWGPVKNATLQKRDDFNFPLVNFPFICCNIRTTSAYGVYFSQLIRYSRDCDSYRDFIDRGMLLTKKLLNQALLVVKIKSPLRKFYGRRHDLVNRYGIFVSQMTTDMFHIRKHFPVFSSFTTYYRVWI